jgi:hypothetical protein
MTIEFTEDSARIKEDKNAITEAYCDLAPNEPLLLSKEKIKIKGIKPQGKPWTLF